MLDLEERIELIKEQLLIAEAMKNKITPDLKHQYELSMKGLKSVLENKQFEYDAQQRQAQINSHRQKAYLFLYPQEAIKQQEHYDYEHPIRAGIIYYFKSIPYALYSIICLPFSRNKALHYLEIAKKLNHLCEYYLTMHDQKTKNLRLRQHTENSEAQAAKELRQAGLDEDTANFCVINPEKVFITILQTIKEKIEM